MMLSISIENKLPRSCVYSSWLNVKAKERKEKKRNPMNKKIDGERGRKLVVLRWPTGKSVSLLGIVSESIFVWQQKINNFCMYLLFFFCWETVNKLACFCFMTCLLTLSAILVIYKNNLALLGDCLTDNHYYELRDDTTSCPRCQNYFIPCRV